MKCETHLDRTSDGWNVRVSEIFNADQRRFRVDQLCFSLGQGCLELKKSALNSAASALIYSEPALMFKNVDKNIKLRKRSQKRWKRMK